MSGLSPEEQWAHLDPVIDALQSDLEPTHGLVNEVIEITGVGRFRRYPLP